MKLMDGLFSLKTLLAVKFGKGAFSLGPIGVALNFLFGVGNLIWIGILALVTAMDWISGIKASKKDGTYSSEYGKEGIYRTLIMLILPVFGNFIDIALASSLIINGVEFGVFFYLITGGLIYHTLMSAAANFKRAGWERWVPVKVIESVASEIQAKTQRSESRKSTFNSNNENGE